MISFVRMTTLSPGWGCPSLGEKRYDLQGQSLNQSNLNSRSTPRLLSFIIISGPAAVEGLGRANGDIHMRVPLSGPNAVL